jgi:hypothetical protein
MFPAAAQGGLLSPSTTAIAIFSPSATHPRVSFFFFGRFGGIWFLEGV